MRTSPEIGGHKKMMAAVTGSATEPWNISEILPAVITYGMPQQISGG